METIPVILRQLFIMAVYCGVGYALHRTRLVSVEGCQAFSRLLLYVVLPCVIVRSFLREATPAATRALVISLAASVLLLALSMLVSRIFLRNQPIDMFSASFSNAGFTGIPLITMALGADAVFYVAGFVALLNILQWTYGQDLLLGKRTTSLRAVLLNPLVLALGIGLVLYALPISLPSLLTKPIGALADCNSPLAMIILGFYLAEVPFRDLFLTPGAWKVTLLRLLVIPALSVLAVAWLPLADAQMKLALILAASAPVGINVAVYAQLLGKDYPRAVVLICQSTVLCLVSLPLIAAMAGALIH